jgi:Shikimate dehydrogenase substrate binding domain
MISGKTTLIAHIGYPTEAFKAPMIYNPWFDKKGIDAVVVPMGVKPEDYPTTLKAIFKLTNIRGALVTMPHKVTTHALVDEITPTGRIAGACNAISARHTRHKHQHAAPTRKRNDQRKSPCRYAGSHRLRFDRTAHRVHAGASPFRHRYRSA